MAINVQTIQGEWNYLCGLARRRWSQLTEDDLGALWRGISTSSWVGFSRKPARGVRRSRGFSPTRFRAARR